MLLSLFIQNYALIDKLEINFNPGFSVITGETGAGKSIILGAIGLLLGQRADTKFIKNGTNKCIVEAHFQITSYHLERFFNENDIEYSADDCILRREVSANGKSRAFINDTPVSLTQMKLIGEKLIDVHSQHQNLLLNRESFQLTILDILSQNDSELKAYQQTFTQYKQTSQELKDLINLSEKSKREEDYLQYQLKQLEEAHLQANEQADLEQEAETLSHAEEIKANLYKSEQLIIDDEKGVLPTLKECIQSIQNIISVYPASNEWQDRLNSCYIEIKDILHDISKAEEDIDFNPMKLDNINERLNLLYTLQQKHKVDSVEKLIDLAENYRKQLASITSLEEHIESVTKQKEELYTQAMKLANKLTESRKKAAVQVERQMKAFLVPLGMPNVQFNVALEQRNAIDFSGIDNVTFLFSANKNSPLQNLASIASGGEIARVMLSLKAMIAGAVKLPTIIFDEIDTGVSGAIAEKMALIMQSMGKQHRQVISITHLPQIAVKGATHYKVYKQDTETSTNSYIRLLTPEERIQEIAHMLSGSTITEAAINNAKALLQENIACNE